MRKSVIQLEGMLQLRDVQYLEVHDKKHVIASVGNRGQSIIVKEFPLKYSENDIARSIGVLTGVVSLDGAYSWLQNRLFRVVFFQGCMILLVAGFICYLFQLLVTRHLKTILSTDGGRYLSLQ